MLGSIESCLPKRCDLHELSLTQNIVDLAIEYAAREKAAKVLSITLEIGALSGNLEFPRGHRFGGKGGVAQRLDSGAEASGQGRPARVDELPAPSELRSVERMIVH